MTFREWMEAREFRPATVTNYLSYVARAERALGHGAPWSKAEIRGLLDTWKGAGSKAGVLRMAVAAMRAAHAHADAPWEFSPRELRLGTPATSGGPVLSAADVGRMIVAVRQNVIAADATGRPDALRLAKTTALVTVFGLRAEEVRGLLAVQIPPTPPTPALQPPYLEVQTAKHGEVRRHTVPPEVRRYLAAAAPREVKNTAVYAQFKRALGFVRPARDGEGWHAVRRAVVTGLLEAGLGLEDVQKWIGWKANGSMAFRYYRPSDLDAKVFAVHPFLKYWR